MPTITSFFDLYQEPTADIAHGGPYTSTLAPFLIAPHGAGWRPDELRQMVLEADIQHAMAFVGLFPYDGEPAGRTRLFHAPASFPRVLGSPTPTSIAGVSLTCCSEVCSFTLDP